MKTVQLSTVLQSTPAGELEALASVYSLADASSTLSNFERSAILREIQIELANRTAAWRSGFMCSSEIEQLAAALEEKENEIAELKLEIFVLEEKLEKAKNRNSKNKS